MKTSLKPFILLAISLSALGLATLATGCASTDTRASTGEYIDDSAITVKVKSAFVKDPVVGAMDVSVETFKGVVQLSGFVNTPAEKAQAEDVAAMVNGVVRVQNNIQIK